MCGIAGLFDLSQTQDSASLEQTVQRMTATLHHRGPDDTGTWVSQESGVAFGHKRLSIVDISPLGHQPMHSASGRYCISYNGEIYNHQELRKELEHHGHTFRGRSDTEVLVEAIDCWGVEATLQRSNGMFAIAVWDTRHRRLTLARDRIGIKPLYYGWAGNCFLFSSELKALRAHPQFQAEIDRDAIAMLLQYCYIPTPYSIYRGIKKLPPGTTLELSLDSTSESASPVFLLDHVGCNGHGSSTSFRGITRRSSRRA